jgi:hypothetical protein
MRFHARALNISVHGVLIESRQSLEIGDDLQLGFELPGETGIVRAGGTVVRFAPPSHYGIELSSAEGDGRQRIKRFVESGLPG